MQFCNSKRTLRRANASGLNLFIENILELSIAYAEKKLRRSSSTLFRTVEFKLAIVTEFSRENTLTSTNRRSSGTTKKNPCISSHVIHLDNFFWKEYYKFSFSKLMEWLASNWKALFFLHIVRFDENLKIRCMKMSCLTKFLCIPSVLIMELRTQFFRI